VQQAEQKTVIGFNEVNFERAALVAWRWKELKERPNDRPRLAVSVGIRSHMAWHGRSPTARYPIAAGDASDPTLALRRLAPAHHCPPSHLHSGSGQIPSSSFCASFLNATRSVGFGDPHPGPGQPSPPTPERSQLFLKSRHKHPTFAGCGPPTTPGVLSPLQVRRKLMTPDPAFVNTLGIIPCLSLSIPLDRSPGFAHPFFLPCLGDFQLFFPSCASICVVAPCSSVRPARFQTCDRSAALSNDQADNIRIRIPIPPSPVPALLHRPLQRPQRARAL
jgi:hypothetical protein